MAKEKVSKSSIRSDYKVKYACRVCKVSGKKSSQLSSKVFKYVISTSIRNMIQSNTTSDKIREKLLQQYPAHKEKLTKDMVRSNIKLESGITFHDTLKDSGQEIENEQSVFIDDMNVAMETREGKEVNVHIMCAISWSGLRRLFLCFNEKQCAQQFTRSVLKKYDKKSLPYQVVMKPSLEDISEVEKLFTRLSLHTLLFYPTKCKVSTPASKYIRKILALVLKPDGSKDIKFQNSKDIKVQFEQAETQISKEQCRKWIERFIEHC